MILKSWLYSASTLFAYLDFCSHRYANNSSKSGNSATNTSSEGCRLIRGSSLESSHFFKPLFASVDTSTFTSPAPRIQIYVLATWLDGNNFTAHCTEHKRTAAYPHTHTQTSTKTEEINARPMRVCSAFFLGRCAKCCCTMNTQFHTQSVLSRAQHEHSLNICICRRKSMGITKSVFPPRHSQSSGSKVWQSCVGCLCMTPYMRAPCYWLLLVLALWLQKLPLAMKGTIALQYLDCPRRLKGFFEPFGQEPGRWTPECQKQNLRRPCHVNHCRAGLVVPNWNG